MPSVTAQHAVNFTS